MGRNIRNLPCISRKSNNQMGVCMFAIDCLKVNGTHLGTCIDRFYFGSCCLLEPINEILDNRIETELLDEREPPMRITNTTAKPLTSTEKLDSIIVTNIANKLSNQSSTIHTYSQTSTTESSKEPVKITTTTRKSPVLITSITTSTAKAPLSESTTIAFGQKLTTSKTTTSKTNGSFETTTSAQKLQTFQVVDGSPLTETTTQSSSTPLTTTAKVGTTLTATKTKKPSITTTTTSKPITRKPTQSKPTPTRPSSTKTTTRKSSLKPKPTKPVGE